jgi:hypothetical protein
MNSDLFFEIFEKFEKAEKRADKIEVLRKGADSNFIQFLIMAFNPNVVFDVEIPQYKPSPDPAGLNYLYLHVEVKKLYRFIKGHPSRPENLTPQRQKELLLQVLEGLHKNEAELLVKCIKKDLRIPFLTTKLIKEAFPGINLGDNDA